MKIRSVFKRYEPNCENAPSHIEFFKKSHIRIHKQMTSVPKRNQFFLSTDTSLVNFLRRFAQ